MPCCSCETKVLDVEEKYMVEDYFDCRYVDDIVSGLFCQHNIITLSHSRQQSITTVLFTIHSQYSTDKALGVCVKDLEGSFRYPRAREGV